MNLRIVAATKEYTRYSQKMLQRTKGWKIYRTNMSI